MPPRAHHVAPKSENQYENNQAQAQARGNLYSIQPLLPALSSCASLTAHGHISPTQNSDVCESLDFSERAADGTAHRIAHKRFKSGSTTDSITSPCLHAYSGNSTHGRSFENSWSVLPTDRRRRTGGVRGRREVGKRIGTGGRGKEKKVRQKEGKKKRTGEGRA
ncbi:hypothetical protein BC567DRAFT_224168 [Phyllosticta citribraziliensis]